MFGVSYLLWRQAGVTGFFITMIYKKEIFLDPLNETQIQAHANKDGLLYIEIADINNANEFDGFHFIVLNKDTAEAFVRTIQQQIKLLDHE